MTTARFRLGNHEFCLPGERAPLSRLKPKERAPIAGAQPPTFLTGCVREPATSQSAQELLKGEFCGHGEPTFTVFDIVCDGHEELDVLLWMPENEDDGPDPDLILARAPGAHGPWLVVFDRAWCDEAGVGRLPESPQWRTLDHETEAQAGEAAERASLSIGFEYPCDADGINVITWLAIHAWPRDHSGAPVVLVDREWA
jgi:hypothetical protein